MKVKPIEWKELLDIIVNCDPYEHIDTHGEIGVVQTDYTIIPIDDNDDGWVGYILEFRGIYEIGYIKGKGEEKNTRKCY